MTGEQTFEFLVQGSAAEPYRIIFTRSGTTVAITCTCQAGVVGQICKHRLSLLAGDTAGLVSSNTADVASVASLLPGTDLEAALHQLREAEEEAEKWRREVSRQRRAVARLMAAT